MALKPWYTVITPREDLRENRPQDASEFAVHLDQVRDKSAPDVYGKPQEFFARTYLTKNLTGLAAEVVRRLSGITTESSAVFNMATQFGGGKTHALTLLYHLANGGPAAAQWPGVNTILAGAGVTAVPRATPAIFVGTEFDSLTGRGGQDGTPLRKTPWGEIAYQLGGEAAFEVVAQHDTQRIAPGGDVIRAFIPQDRPCLILMDELMNYISRDRKSGLGDPLHSFVHNLSETVRGMTNVVLAISVPASEMEMTREDVEDYNRLLKVLDRLGKAVMMSEETEIAEIIRRRLFEFDAKAVSQDGKMLLNKDAQAVCSQYAKWVVDHRQQLPNWFPTDNAAQAFAATYPFHPMVLSVFERKWATLPRFQRTRGVLRLLAQWVAQAYADGFQGAHKDPLIGLGTAPLDYPNFREAMFQQLGEERWEAAITTDICGKAESHATRLDKDAVEAIKKARLHRKAATAIFFESNGGQTRAEATLPELRLAIAEPGTDIGNVETVLESLTSYCYYLMVEKNRYHFSLSPNLNKLLADRRATVKAGQVDEKVRAEVQKVFPRLPGVDVVAFPNKSSDIDDKPVITVAVLAPDQCFEDSVSQDVVKEFTQQHGAKSRTFKSALIWSLADSATVLRDEARKFLALRDIRENDWDTLDANQKQQVTEDLPKAERDLQEAAWRSYRHILFLGKDGQLRHLDMGLIHSSAGTSMTNVIVERLRQESEVVSAVSPNFVAKNWPPAFTEWPTRNLRDAFFASPQFPRLLKGDAVAEAIAQGVANSKFAYVEKTADGQYEPFLFGTDVSIADLTISADTFLITKEAAEAYLQSRGQAKSAGPDDEQDKKVPAPDDGGGGKVPDPPPTPDPENAVHNLTWSGQLPSQKWTNFYTRVLSKHAVGSTVKLTLTVEVSSDAGISPQKVEETKSALRELGLDDDISCSP